MTHDEKLVEAVAQSIAAAEDEYDRQRDPGSATCGPWEKWPDHWKDELRFQARAALDAINLDETIRAAVAEQRRKDAEIARNYRPATPPIAAKMKFTVGAKIADAIEAQS